MNKRKKKLLAASVAGILAVAGFISTGGVSYGMGDKPEKAADTNSCSGKSACSGKSGCGGPNGCGGKNGCPGKSSVEE